MSQAATLGQAIDSVISVLQPLDEKSRNTVLTAVCSHLDMQQNPASSAPATFPAANNGEAPGPAALMDIRSFKAQKQPQSPRQMACLVAFYLQEMAPQAERKDSITAADLEKYFKQGGFKLPSRIGQVLIDAKASGYFDSVGRAEYRLNPVGYNLVAHSMPTKPE